MNKLDLSHIFSLLRLSLRLFGKSTHSVLA
nr:MAG TPA: hypothetical protein [Caudoviricetes sp.]